MSIIIATLRDLSRTLRCGDHQSETVVRDARSARAALSRRGLFVAVGAVASGVCFATLAPSIVDLQLTTWKGVPFPAGLYGLNRSIVYSSETGLELHVNGALVAKGSAAADAIAFMAREVGW